MMMRRSRCSTTRSSLTTAPYFGRRSRALQCVVAVNPSSNPAAASISEPVHTDVVYVVVSWALPYPLQHALVVDQRPRPEAAREHDDVRRWHVLERGVDLDPEDPVVRADDTRSCPTNVTS